jgi:hypothetical protein
MSNHFPITPPPELVQQWNTEGRHQDYCTLTESIATRAAQWGADQELEACCEWVEREIGHGREWNVQLRATRRPKPPSLKEQALAKLPEHPESMASYLSLSPGSVATIRRALEDLDD